MHFFYIFNLTNSAQYKVLSIVPLFHVYKIQLLNLIFDDVVRLLPQNY